MEEQTAWLECIINKNDATKSIHKVLSVDMKSAVPAGTNYASIIQRATLNVILRSGRKAKLTLIVKKSHDVKEKAESLEEFSLFKTEIVMYSKVLVKYDQLMNEYQDKRDKLWGDLIGFQPYDLIIFRDLKQDNFKVADRTCLLDKHHAQLVLNSLARFHAMGHVLIQKGLISRTDLNKYYLEVESPVIQNFLTGGLEQLCNVIISDWPSEWQTVGERLSKQLPIIAEKLRNLFQINQDSFITVCHGDCWTCNLMFKYCPYDETVPIAVKYLDFQCSHVNSYAFDIIYFLYVSVIPEVRRTYWNELILEYQKTLASTLSSYGIDGKAPTLEHIEAEVKRLEYYAMAVNLIYLPITSTEVEAPYLLEKLNIGCNGVDAFNPKIFNTEKYKNAVQSELQKWFKREIY